MLQHAYLCEDVKVVEFEGLLGLAKGVSGRRFRNILSAGVFIENIESGMGLVAVRRAQWARHT